MFVHARLVSFVLVTLISNSPCLSASEPLREKTRPEEGTKRPAAYFEPNVGQFAPGVRYQYRDGSRSIDIAANRISFGNGLDITLQGASARAEASNAAPQSGVSNYFKGNDPARWQTRVPHYGRVTFESVYQGVDLAYYPTTAGLEYDFIVEPGGDSDSIALGMAGATRIQLDADGDLLIETASGQLRQHRPIAYQMIDGRKTNVACSFVLSTGTVRFELGAYDQTRELVIDPIIDYATYLGGVNDDFVADVTLDANGAMYLVGFAGSANYPTTPGVLKPVAELDMYVVTKIAPNGTLAYSTFLGGNLSPLAGEKFAIAVNAAGEAYIGGLTAAADFPTTVGAFQRTLRGDSDAFLAKLSADGSRLIYSTLLGGDKAVVPTELQGDDLITGVAVDSTGAAYVVGNTVSFGFPTTAGAIARERTGEGGCEGCSWAFAAKLAPDGGSLVYSTYLGGIAVQIAEDVAVDSNGAAYLVGRVSSPNFPTTPGSFQPQLAPATDDFVDGFILKLNPSGTAVEYGSFLGGGGLDVAYSVALDASRNAYVTGISYSLNFPVTDGVVQPNHHGSGDVFVAKVSADGSTLGYATYIGGSNYDAGRSIAVRGDEAYVTGETLSPDFRIVDPAQAKFGGPAGGENAGDAFVARVNSAGSALISSTYLGGARGDNGRGIAVDSTGRVYVVGNTFSVDFPTRPDAIPAQASNGGFMDFFVAVLDPIAVPPPAVNSVAQAGKQFSIKITGTNFKPAARVFIGGDTTPWPTVKQKGSTKITLKKGVTLQNRFPRGEAVPIRIVNADGGIVSTSFTRP